MKRFVIVLIFLSLLPLFNLVTPGIMDAHDAPDHVARIANFYQSLSEGIIVPRWAGNLNWGYGHPILMFLYPLPSYLASLFHSLGAPLDTSVKLVFAVTYVASILTFFLWAKRQWNTGAGAVGALLYGFAPYRFVDLYVRGALGEHVAFVFPPIVFLGLLRLAKEKSVWSGILVALGVSGLILSHNAVSLMMFPLVFLYGWYVFSFESIHRREFVGKSLFYVLTGFMIAAFFWMPAFFEGKYTLRDIVTKGEFANRFVPFFQFFYSPWNYGISNFFSKALGVGQWGAVIMGMYLAAKVKDTKTRVFFWASLITLIASLVVQTSAAKWIWTSLPLLQKFQFPWRFLTVGVFVSAMIGSLVVVMLPKKLTWVGWVLASIAIITTVHMWSAKSYIVRAEPYYTGIYRSTTDTGESSPIWSIRFMEHVYEAPLELIDGDVTVQQIFRSSTVHEYEVIAGKDSRLVENTLYFPGWRVLVDEVIVPVEFQDPGHRGLMTFWVSEGVHLVRVEFMDTKLRKAATIITLMGLFVLGIASTIQLWQVKKRRR